MTSDNEIFIDHEYPYRGVERWTLNGTKISSSMSMCPRCFSLFVDRNNNLYCSGTYIHQVLSQSLQDPSNQMTSCPGSASNMLDEPRGIFVTTNFDLYVADFGNDRVQLFRRGKVNAVTVAGNGTSGNILLRRPVGVVLDADGYLFIMDSGNHRIVRSAPNGFHCVARCFGTSGPSSYQLNFPQAMSFDRDGNLFVVDHDNRRIQKFLLSNNTCGT